MPVEAKEPLVSQYIGLRYVNTPRIVAGDGRAGYNDSMPFSPPNKVGLS